MAELNASATNWLADLEMDDYDLFPQCPLSLLDDDDDHSFLSHDLVSALKGEDDDNNYLESLQQTLSSADETCFEIPVTSTITEHVSPVLSPSSSHPSSPTSPQILSFDNSATLFYGFDANTFSSNQNDAVSVLSLPRPGNMNFSAQPQARKAPPESQHIETRKGTKRPRESQDHIMAERKRREKLSQSLIALAALIPGLKKMDKASVLGDAIKYVKELQERLRVLEEQSNKRSEVESVVIVNSDDDSSSCDDESFEAASGGGGGEVLPHVEARVAEKEVLLRIHCQKHKGIYVKLLAEIQRLHLSVVNSSALPFGDSVLDITIVAQMGTDYKLTIRDLVRNLRVATLRSMS